MLKDIITYVIIKLIFSFNQLKIPELCLVVEHIVSKSRHSICPNKALSLMGDTDINQIITQPYIKLHLLQIKGHMLLKRGWDF